MKETFILHLQALRDKNGTSPPQPGAQGTQDEADQAMAVITESKADYSAPQAQQILDNPEIDLPEELVQLINQIKEDLGHIPPSYFSAAAGVSGAGLTRRESSADDQGEELGGQEGILLDEWDYRRNGYRKNWCRIREREMPLLHSTFVDTTLEKHRGLLLKLRRQFEFMKTSEQFVRRQREGDDIDLDARAQPPRHLAPELVRELHVGGAGAGDVVGLGADRLIAGGEFPAQAQAHGQHGIF